MGRSSSVTLDSATLTWAAATTERVGLGTSVLVVPSHEPVGLANRLASLDNLSGGRLIVAAQRGDAVAERPRLVAALDGPPGRHRRLTSRRADGLPRSAEQAIGCW